MWHQAASNIYLHRVIIVILIVLVLVLVIIITARVMLHDVSGPGAQYINSEGLRMLHTDEYSPSR